MEFDKTRIYTAVNANELPIGSKCYFANQLSKLKEAIRENKEPFILKETHSEEKEHRFDDGGLLQYSLAYLVELPKEKVVKPFETIEEAREAIAAHGGFLKSKDDSVYFVTAYTACYETCYDDDRKPSVCIINSWYSLEDLAEIFVFADDGSPCGKPVEE